MVFLGATLTQVAVAGVAFSFLHFVNLEEILDSLFRNRGRFTLSQFRACFLLSAVRCNSCVDILSNLQTEAPDAGWNPRDHLRSCRCTKNHLHAEKPVGEVSEIESILKGDILFIGRIAVLHPAGDIRFHLWHIHNFSEAA